MIEVLSNNKSFFNINLIEKMKNITKYLLSFILLTLLTVPCLFAQESQETPNLFGQLWTIKLPSEEERISQMTEIERKNYLQMSEDTRQELEQELRTQANNSFFIIKMDGTFNLNIKDYLQQEGSWKLDPENHKILHIKYTGGVQDGETDKIFIKELKADKIVLALESQQITGQELVLVPRK